MRANITKILLTNAWDRRIIYGCIVNWPFRAVQRAFLVNYLTHYLSLSVINLSIFVVVPFGAAFD